MLIHITISPGDGFFMTDSAKVGLSDDLIERHTKEMPCQEVVKAMSFAAIKLWRTPAEGRC